MSRYIDAEKLKENFEKESESATDLFDAFDFALEATPTVDVEEVKHGKWIMEGGVQICSVCHNRARVDFNYRYIASERCSHCGAKMDLE